MNPRRLSPRHKDRSQGHFPITQKVQKFVEVPRVVQRLSRSPRDLEDREVSTTDPARSEPRGPDRPSEVGKGQGPERGQRQDPAWSKAQSGQSRQTDPARSEPSVSVKSRHEPVPQPEGQSASRPVCLVTHPCPGCFFQAAGVTFQLPREGRRACLSVRVLPPSLLSSVVFPCWFPGSFLEAGAVL